MTKSLQSSMAPLFIISWFHCLGLFEYPLGKSRLHFSCLYALALWGFYMYYYIIQSINLWQHSSRVILIIFLLYDVMALPSIFISFYRYKDLKACLRELSLVDDTLEALGVPKDYRMLRNWIIQIIIGWTAILFTDIIFNIFHFIFVRKIELILYILLQIFLILLPTDTDRVIILSALNCGFVLGYMSSRFHRVNERLQVLYSDLFENNYKCRSQNRFILVRQQQARVKYHKQYLWILM
ncbi:hypothetical protein ALC62_07521 [Cyphomyrmex costatus]|uniref:Gustatory receptor n=1 Tax=Cyphomyrmex costatus TaxID=456900 RepID=A0A151IHQ3_9HYME|nr:hypothetical protein ALC62_07521 [Cyphomyrmex costatus]